MDPSPEDRIVTTSQIRAIGRMMLWPSCYSDSAFVTDSAEILLDVLKKDIGRGGGSSSSSSHNFTQKSVALSGTWTLANLAGVLAMQVKMTL